MRFGHPRALGALPSGPRLIRGGPTIPCWWHGEEGQHGRRPAQRQPPEVERGPQRLGRPALLWLVGDVPASPPRPASRCIPRRSRRARDPRGSEPPGGRPQEGWCPFKGGQHRHAKPAARARKDGAGRAPGFVNSLIRWHRIDLRSFSRHASRPASVATAPYLGINPKALVIFRIWT